MAKKIYFTSLKGGTGVTTCVVGIGFALAMAGERTLIFDGDEHTESALTIAGMSGNNAYTLKDAKLGACRVKQAIIQHRDFNNLYILPSYGCGDKDFAVEALDEIEGLFDYVLCDKTALKACTQAIAVTEPYTLSVKSCDKCLSKLKDDGIDDVGIIVNKVNGGLVYDGATMSPTEIATVLRAKLTAVIPEDLQLPIGKWKKKQLNAFKLAADVISGNGKTVLKVVKPYSGMVGFFKRKMRNNL